MRLAISAIVLGSSLLAAAAPHRMGKAGAAAALVEGTDGFIATNKVVAIANTAAIEPRADSGDTGHTSQTNELPQGEDTLASPQPVFITSTA